MKKDIKFNEFLSWISSLVLKSELNDNDKFEYFDFLNSEAKHNGIDRLIFDDYIDEFKDYKKFLSDMAEYRKICIVGEDAYAAWEASMTGDYEFIDYELGNEIKRMLRQKSKTPSRDDRQRLEMLEKLLGEDLWK